MVVCFLVGAPVAFLIRFAWVMVNGRTKTIEVLRAENAELRTDLRAERATVAAGQMVTELERAARDEALRELETSNADAHRRLLALEGGPPQDLIEGVEMDQHRITRLLRETPDSPEGG